MLRVWFVSLAHSHLGQYMQTSKWGFAIVETVHLLALAILGGAVLIVDLRLIGRPANPMLRTKQRDQFHILSVMQPLNRRDMLRINTRLVRYQSYSLSIQKLKSIRLEHIDAQLYVSRALWGS